MPSYITSTTSVSVRGELHTAQTATQDAIAAALDAYRAASGAHERGRRWRWPGPTLVAAPTGAGKTTALQAALRDHPDTPVLILTRTQQLALELAAGIPGAVVYRGRNGRTDEDGAPADEGHCHRYPTVAALGSRQRLIAPLACVTCPHGYAARLAQATGDLERADVVMRARQVGIDFEALSAAEACSWQGQRIAIERATVVVACHASYSSTLATYHDPIRGQIPRLVVVDEPPDLLAPIVVEPSDPNSWLQVIARDLPYWQRRRDDAEAEAARRRSYGDLSGATTQDAEAAEAGRHLAALRAAEPILQELAVDLARLAGTSGEVPVDVQARIRELSAACAGLVQDQAASWERAVLAWDGAESGTPLRAIRALAWACEHDTLAVHQGVIVGSAPTALGEALLTASRQVVALDATPPRALCATVEALGGRVVRVAAAQNATVVVDPSRQHGLSWRGPGLSSSAGAGRRHSAVSRIDAQVRSTFAELDRVVVFVAKDLVEELRTALPEVRGVQNWGRERGVNDYAGCDVALFGGPLGAPAAMEIAWRADRALALTAGADPADWPVWSDAVERGVAIEIAPGVAVRSPVPLPADPAIREWVADRATALHIQAAGRARALRSEREVRILAAGGVPARWGDHGYRVVVAAAAGRGANHARHVDAFGRLDMAAGILTGRGERISRRRVVAELHGMGLVAPGPATYSAWRIWVAAGRPAIPAPVQRVVDRVVRIARRGPADHVLRVVRRAGRVTDGSTCEELSWVARSERVRAGRVIRS